MFMGMKCGMEDTVKLRIALLNAPCYGFGDVIFAQKLAKYLREWYGCRIDIFTTLPNEHIQLGENPKNIVKPIGLVPSQKQCKTFNKLKFPNKNVHYDLFLIAPLVNNFVININYIKKIFKYANKNNIYYFSEYNSNTAKYDFPMGIGRGKYGIFLVDPPPMKRLSILKNPYSMFYIASGEHIPNARKCYTSFIEMVCGKYHKKYKKLDIVAPNWVNDDLDDDYVEIFIEKIGKYYPNICIKTKDDTEYILENNNKSNILTLRLDVLPVNNKQMFSLMKYSIPDILLTGDQSITDALSCCKSKNIFYQIAPWKESFGRQLTKHLPNKYLKHKKTSCGTLKAISYKSNYDNFLKEWDFRTLARPKIDAMMLSAVFLRKL